LALVGVLGLAYTKVRWFRRAVGRLWFKVKQFVFWFKVGFLTVTKDIEGAWRSLKSTLLVFFENLGWEVDQSRIKFESWASAGESLGRAFGEGIAWTIRKIEELIRLIIKVHNWMTPLTGKPLWEEPFETAEGLKDVDLSGKKKWNIWTGNLPRWWQAIKGDTSPDMSLSTWRRLEIEGLKKLSGGGVTGTWGEPGRTIRGLLAAPWQEAYQDRAGRPAAKPKVRELLAAPWQEAYRDRDGQPAETRPRERAPIIVNNPTITVKAETLRTVEDLHDLLNGLAAGSAN